MSDQRIRIRVHPPEGMEFGADAFDSRIGADIPLLRRAGEVETGYMIAATMDPSGDFADVTVECSDAGVDELSKGTHSFVRLGAATGRRRP